MNKLLLLLISSLIALGFGSRAQAQMPLQLFRASQALGHYNNKQMSARPVSMETYQGRQYPMQRTPPAQLPKQDAELITSVEAQLDQCYAAMLADATGPVCSPAQHFALQGSLARLVRARLHWSTEAYEQEMAFYLTEDALRQRAAAPAKAAPAK